MLPFLLPQEMSHNVKDDNLTKLWAGKRDGYHNKRERERESSLENVVIFDPTQSEGITDTLIAMSSDHS